MRLLRPFAHRTLLTVQENKAEGRREASHFFARPNDEPTVSPAGTVRAHSASDVPRSLRAARARAGCAAHIGTSCAASAQQHDLVFRFLAGRLCSPSACTAHRCRAVSYAQPPPPA